MRHVCGDDISSPLVRVEYEQELIFTEVLRHPQGLNFCKAVSQHLAYTGLSYRFLGQFAIKKADCIQVA